MLSALGLPLLVKAVATAAVVVTAARVAQSVGPLWAALIAALPVSTGPAYVLLALDHDAEFIAASALNSAAANAVTAVFLAAYALLARRLGRLVPALAVTLGLWLGLCLGLRQMPLPPLGVLALNLATYGAALWLLRPAWGTGTRPDSAARPAERGPSQWRGLLLRAALVALFVAALVSLSTALGPDATGMMAVFPVSLGSLIVLSAPRLGVPATAGLAEAALRPMLGFGIMLLVLNQVALGLGTWAALGIALAVSLAWSLGLALVALASGRRSEIIANDSQ